MKKRCTLSQLTSLVGACPIARGRVPGMAFTPSQGVRGQQAVSARILLAFSQGPKAVR